ncbi:carbamoyl phosphate synthase small subunit, partial [Mycobacterium tuberculosis]|nr:carbamoyl phosphate synthase small subunit [Mycobacterium tuberculosis]
MLETVLATPPMAGSQLADEVSVSEPELVPAVGEAKFSVAAVDLGIKARTPQRLAERGVDVHFVPAAGTFEETRALGVGGV